MRFSGHFRQKLFAMLQKPTGERVLAALPFSKSLPEPEKPSRRKTDTPTLRQKKDRKKCN
jgi:hypothetical protein